MINNFSFYFKCGISHHFPVQTRRTVIPLPPESNPDYDLDLLDIGQYAHVEVEAVNTDGEPAPSDWQRSLNVSDLAGDLLGTLHVGENDRVVIRSGEGVNTTLVPFHVVVYQVRIAYFCIYL